MRVRSLCGAGTLLFVGSCSPVAPTMDAGREDAGGRDIGRLEGGSNSIALSSPIAFEGQRRYVGSIGPSRDGDSLLSAQVMASEASGIVIDRVECSRIRCGVVAHIEDTTPNRGSAIPEPTGAETRSITVIGAELNYTATLQVFPLDSADAMALGKGQIAGDAVYSSLSIAAGATLRASMLGRVARLAVLSSADIHGVFDFSAGSDGPGPGGFAGGEAPMADGQGPLPGIGSAIAGGGGGNGTAGEAGRGVGTEVGGAGGAAVSPTAVTRLAGGSGGGAGAGGRGGDGGGALALLLFGAADLDGARFLLGGGGGMGAGGGGAGGMLVLAGAPTGSYTIDVSGGDGGAQGGALGGRGAPGRVRLDGIAGNATMTGAVAVRSLRFDIANIPPLVRDPLIVIPGFATPGTHVRVQNEARGVVTARADAVADAEGRWSVMFDLTAGVASFIAYDVTVAATPIASLSGTTVVVRGMAGARELYSGALDVVYVPMAE